MNDKERKSCINTIELLRRLAFNVHGVMDVIDAQNCDKIIEMLNKPEPHWIPCSEKPDRRDVYRVTVQCEHVDSYPDYEVCYGEYDEENGWFLLGEPVGRIKMVAWMRIDYVEPYQPEEESGGLR